MGGKVDCARVMDSKKLPIWLVFQNADPRARSGKEVNVIFKAGDDLRQDMLTLQLIRITDMMWKDNDLDLKMSPYECLSTGDEVGLLEVVMDSKTIAGIQGGAKAALRDDTI